MGGGGIPGGTRAGGGASKVGGGLSNAGGGPDDMMLAIPGGGMEKSMVSSIFLE